MNTAKDNRIGKLIAARRAQMTIEVKGKHRPLSASGFGRKIGLEGASVYALERGDVLPSFATLVRLVRCCGMDPVILLGEPSDVDVDAVEVAA